MRIANHHFCVTIVWVVIFTTGEEQPRASSPGLEVVGGSPADPHEYPWQASLRIRGTHSCGGSLIDSRWVLTAAHCLGGPTTSVWLGAHNRTSKSDATREYTIQCTWKHPEHGNSRYNNDIGLVLLTSPVTFSPEIQPVSLPSAFARVPAGTNCTITGWGALYYGGYAPRELQEADVPVIANENCSSSAAPLTENMLCAGFPAGGVDTCSGDSGGPLVCSLDGSPPTLYGATSFGWGCAWPGEPGVYAKVANFIPWLEETMSEGSCPDSTSSGTMEDARPLFPSQSTGAETWSSLV